MITSSISLALAQLRVNALRSGLTVLGVVIGIASVVALVSLGSGVQASIEEDLAGLGANTLLISPGEDDGEDPAPRDNLTASAGAAPDLFTTADLDAVAAAPGIDLVSPVVQRSVEVELGDTARTTLMATTSDLIEIESYELAAGSWFSDLTDDAGLPVAVIGGALAEELALDPAAALDEVIEIDGRSYTVIGVLEPLGGIAFVDPDDAVLVPLDAARGDLIDADAEIDLLRASTDGDDAAALASVEDALRTSRGIDPDEELDATLTDSGEISAIADETTSILTTLVTSIGAISLIVGAIGIANMMLVAVRERTQEIGVRRAVGATRQDITTQFLIEAVVLSLVGGIIGTVLGLALNTVVSDLLLGVPAVVSGVAVASAIGTSLVVGVLAGLGPAYQAASVDPTTALRYE